MVIEIPTEQELDIKIYPEILYSGSNGHTVTKKMLPDGDELALPLGPSLRLISHSPTGFSWGYGGSGPAQLSLALLLDATDNPETATQYYQDFKWSIVSDWPVGDRWEMKRSDILGWLQAVQAEEMAKRQGIN